MKKWLWIAAFVIAGAYFAKMILPMLAKLPIVGTFFQAKVNTDIKP